MKYPKNVLIYGKSYEIIQEENIKDDDGTSLDGSADLEKAIISITASLKKNEKLQTFMHEFIHVTLRRVGLNQAQLSEDLEEVICESLSTMFTETFSHLRFKKQSK